MPAESKLIYLIKTSKIVIQGFRNECRIIMLLQNSICRTPFDGCFFYLVIIPIKLNLRQLGFFKL